ncbi:MAG TPA: hypothetical protein VFP26_10805, partial [Gemmatimonadaceae bacterium]|nr:hypothetical protein [Gemmatimonadaceae bacterium]
RSLGYCYLYARRYDPARYHLDRAIAMNPVAEESHRIQGLILTFAGDFAGAERVLREALSLAPPNGATTKATLAYSLARAGDQTYARAVAAEFERRMQTEYISPVDLTMVQLGLGNRDAALDWIDRSIAERRGWAAYLRVHPLVDELRGDPRFEALVAKMTFDAPAAPPIAVPPSLALPPV